jgi:ZIP family zinc transporter
MTVVFWTALGVGGATLIGALLGFVTGRIPHKFNDIILGFAAGVMLCAAVVGLILPSLESGSVPVVVAGILCGAVFLNLLDRFTPHLHRIAGVKEEQHPQGTEKLNKVMLFVAAIAIHNLPEGIAAGVSFGGGDTSAGIAVAAGISLQNIPEGMVMITPLLSVGVSRRRTLALAAFTGLVEVAGTFFGYAAVGISQAVLPFALAFAGGCMLYVISDEMIPETHSHGYEQPATYSILLGFCLMLAMDAWLA